MTTLDNRKGKDNTPQTDVNEPEQGRKQKATESARSPEHQRATIGIETILGGCNV